MQRLQTAVAQFTVNKTDLCKNAQNDGEASLGSSAIATDQCKTSQNDARSELGKAAT